MEEMHWLLIFVEKIKIWKNWMLEPLTWKGMRGKLTVNQLFVWG